MSLGSQIEELINQSVLKIDGIAKSAYPNELAKLAEEIFASGGKSHGRNWADNTASTQKRKGGNSPNIDTGLLEHTLTQTGFLQNDDYMDKLPKPIKSKSSKGKKSNSSDDPNGYKFANKMRPFDDIGKTDDDKEWVVKEVIKRIISEYN